MAAQLKLTFPILWDEQSKVAEAFGLAFALPDDLKTVYLGFGNDLAVRNGDPSWRLPVPARFVIDARGIVRSVMELFNQHGEVVMTTTGVNFFRRRPGG